MTAIELDLMVAAKVIRISDCTECEMDIHDSNEDYIQAAAHWRYVAEKSQIQALSQFQPVLPPSTPERHSPDDVRPGSTSLLAELDVARGKVIRSLRKRRRAQEFKEFLVEIDTEVPADLNVHLILDNYATHKAPEIRRWLLRHPRFHLHFMPISDSWLSMVERWFADRTTQKIKRGAHTSVKTADQILAALARY